jgi:hypothetical protein
MDKENNRIDIIQLANYVRPEVKETSNKEFVMNGEKNSFYSYVIDRYNGSPTNRAIIDSYAKYIYGKGLTSRQRSVKPIQFAQVLQKISKKDLRNICQDYATFSEASMECIYKNGVLQKIKHVAKNFILPNKMNEKGDIERYWYSMDFNEPRKYKPVPIDAWVNGKKNGSYIKIISSYQLGKSYFTDPDYMAGLPYAELEEEIANYCIKHIKNGLSLGHIINMNQGLPPSEEVRQDVKRAFKRDAQGSNNAGNTFINWNESKDTGITIEAIEVANIHEQYNFLTTESTQKLLISHKVTNPILFGIKTDTGLGNNANEMQVAFESLMTYVIQPKQEIILDNLIEIFNDAGLAIDLDFIPLVAPVDIDVDVKLSKEEKSNDPIIADWLIELGEEISDEWELIDEVEQKGKPILNETALNLAKTFSSFPNVKSEQDTSLFKIRYSYEGSENPEREFCSKMVKANKVYRKEDIELAETKIVNAGLGLNGADTYSIWLYKGGVNCKHFWQRKIYLRKGNNSISVNEARKMILELDPADRPMARWQENDPLVAQPAQESNNNFRAN